MLFYCSFDTCHIHLTNEFKICLKIEEKKVQRILKNSQATTKATIFYYNKNKHDTHTLYEKKIKIKDINVNEKKLLKVI